MKHLHSSRSPINTLFVVLFLVLAAPLGARADSPDDSNVSDDTSYAQTVPALESYIELPLAELSHEAAEHLAGFEGTIGVAVLVPSRNTIYSANGDGLFPLASVAKVIIMAMAMDKAEREERPLKDQDLGLLEAMITISDNDAASELWRESGGSPTFSEYLHSLGLTDVELAQGDYWGDTRASPRDMALLLDRLVQGQMLDQEHTGLAIDLLLRVIPEQRWGIAVGETDASTQGLKVGVKNGWYPDDSGWWVNSTGFAMLGDGSLAFIIAILTENQPTITDGMATIEGLAALIETTLYSEAVAATFSAPKQPPITEGVATIEHVTLSGDTPQNSDDDDSPSSE